MATTSRADSPNDAYYLLLLVQHSMLFDQLGRTTTLKQELPTAEKAIQPTSRLYQESLTIRNTLLGASQEASKVLGYQPETAPELAVGLLMMIFDLATDGQRKAWFGCVRRETYRGKLLAKSESAQRGRAHPLYRHAQHIRYTIMRPDRLVGQS